MPVVTGPDNEKTRLLERWINEHQTPLLRVCYLYLRDRQLAEDAVQETFLKAYRAMDTFRGDADAKTWLTRIAVHTCLDMRRGSWFRHVDRRVSLDMLPEPAFEATEDDRELTLAVLSLPDKLREAVVLYY